MTIGVAAGPGMKPDHLAAGPDQPGQDFRVGVLVLIMSSFAADPPSIPEIPTERSLERTEHEDGTYSLRLEESIAIGDTRQDGFVTWRYEGQARFQVDPQPYPSTVELVGEEERSESDSELLFRTVKTDANGSIWSVADVDEQAWSEYVEAYNSAHPEEEDVHEMERPTVNEDVPVGTSYQIEPRTWVTTGNCGAFTNRTWEGESRLAIGTGHTPQERGAVTINDLGTGGRCTGVLIEDSHVLTAAHCVADSNSNAVPVTRIQVCRDVSPVCVSGSFSINSIFVPGSYSGGTATCCGTDAGDDWAIIKLGFPLMPQADTQALSAAGNSTITNLIRTREVTNPGFVTGCTANAAMRRNIEVESPASTTTKKVRHRADTVAGESGAPFYYCPAGDDSFCDATDVAFVYSVHAIFNSFNMRVVGPKVPNFRSAALAFIATSPQ